MIIVLMMQLYHEIRQKNSN